MTRLAVWGVVLGVGVMLALGSHSVQAAGSSTDPSSTANAKPKADPNYVTAEKYVKIERYQDAIPLLQKVVDADPTNADAFNYLGYSHRKLGKFDAALAYYGKAIEIEPDYAAVRQYLGEAYVQLGKTDDAKAQLAKIKDICGTGCDEYKTLEKLISANGKKG